MNGSAAVRKLRRGAARGARQVLARIEPSALAPLAPPPAPPEPPPAEPAQPPAPAYVPPQRGRALGVERGTVTNVLRARLDPPAVAAIGELIAEQAELQELFERASPTDRDRLLLAFAVHLGVEQVTEQAGLPTVQPPEDVHAMARGPMAAAGGIYEADMVVDALASAGVEIAAKRSALDFGCSSGRVLRVLSSAYPQISWHGCDPNEPAIAWAREHIPAARFFRNDDDPPLDLPSASLDLVYAISIWSHFEPALGLRWLDEMRRLLRPGGHLVLTTHGSTTIAHDGVNGLRTPEQLSEASGHLVAEGAWYIAEFGDEGDWGVMNPKWGTAFLSPEWLLSHACPQWRVLEFAPGRNAGNQDVYVLERA